MVACTLDSYTVYLLSSMGQTSATGLSLFFDDLISHDRVSRWLTSICLETQQVWIHAKLLIRQTERELVADDFAVLIVDDSILERAHTNACDLLCIYYYQHLGPYVKGLNFVRLLNAVDTLSVPIAEELVEKKQVITDPRPQQVSYKYPLTKSQLLQAMLCVALLGWPQPQAAYRYLLADSRNASAENMNTVRRHEFIFALPNSRTVVWTQEAPRKGEFLALDTVVSLEGQLPCVWLRNLEEAVLVVQQVPTNKNGPQGM